MKLRMASQWNPPLAEGTPLARLLNEAQHKQNYISEKRRESLFAQFLLRRAVVSQVRGRHCLVNGRPVINFGSANYLGLEHHPEVVYASKRALDELGTEPGGPRRHFSHENVLELEHVLAQMLGAESALVGHDAPQVHAAAIPALFGDEESVLFVDGHPAPGMAQGALLAQAAGARLRYVNAGDPDSLVRAFTEERTRGRKGALLTSGLSPLTGLHPDLARLDELCREQGIILYIDDSHGIGVLGQGGGGAVEACGLGWENLIVVGSLQNALGAYGGFLAGNEALVDLLRVVASTAPDSLQPAAVEGALAAVRIARSAEGSRLRTRLAEDARMLRSRLAALDFQVPPGDSPVISVRIGKEIKTMMAGRKLFDSGVFLQPLLPPEVPQGSAILRISLTASHTATDIEKLVGAFRELRAYLVQHENPLRQAAHVLLEVGKARWQGERYAGL